MVEYLRCSGTKCLDFQLNGEKNRKSVTPVEIPNFSLPPATDSPPLRIYLLNTNRRQCTVFGECLWHWLLQNINHHGSEHINWGAWWVFRAWIISSGCSDDLCNQRDVYFIIIGWKGLITSCIGWVHGERFKGAELGVAVNCRFLCCWCLCEMPFSRQSLLLTKIYKYPEVCFKGCRIRLLGQFLFSKIVRGSK